MTELTTIHGQQIDIQDELILCNDVTLPWEYNPHNTRLWLIYNEYGPLGVIWANHEQDALDAIVDAGLGNSLLIEESDATDDSPRLGNACEPANLDYCAITPIRLDPAKDCRLLCHFAEARGANRDNLYA